jgi:hypothetical protein
MAELDQINVSTKRYIEDNPALVDNIFQADPVSAYMRRNLEEGFPGGTLIQTGFTHDVMPGGPYSKGEEFDISERQVEQAMQHTPRLLYADVTLSLEDIEIFNRGSNAAFSLLDSRMTSAYMSMGAFLGIGLYLEGQNANYVKNLNGLSEAINDNSTASFDGSTFSTYGGITRGGSVGNALNGNVSTLSGAKITYDNLEDTYASASFGTYEPNLGVTTVVGFSAIKKRFQTQQRFNDTQDPAIGFNGLKFNSATIIKSRYCPGSAISASTRTTNFREAFQYVDQMSGGGLTAYPTISNETLFWLNAREPFFRFYVSDSKLFQFGFTGFKPAQGNTKVAGQILFSGNLVLQPRYHAQVVNFT